MVPGDRRAEPSERVTEVEFRLTDACYPLVDASEREGCRLTLEEIVPESSGGPLEFFSVRGTPVGNVEQVLDEADGVEPRVIDEFSDGGILRVRVHRSCPVVTLADGGAIYRDVVAEDGEARIVADVLPASRANAVFRRLREEHPSVEMVAKRDRPVTAPTFMRRQLQAALDESLTQRQREALTTAYLGGYYDDPREVTGQELAARLDIAPSTFTKHLRAAERAVFSLLFTEEFGDPTEPFGEAGELVDDEHAADR